MTPPRPIGPRLRLTGCWYDDLPGANEDNNVRRLARSLERGHLHITYIGLMPPDNDSLLCAAALRRLVE